jgi:hypothetical protein
LHDDARGEQAARVRRRQPQRIPVIAADIIYEGAAVGLVDAPGHARPLHPRTASRVRGVHQADNSAGAAAAINVRVIESGKIQLAVSGAVITDVGQPVYATDDDTFVFNPVAASSSASCTASSPPAS